MTTAALFSCALGVASVALPLRAIESGYSASQVGLLVALTAAAQLMSRVGMGVWLRYLPDWIFIFIAALLLATSCGIAALTASGLPFLVAHLLQGSARAFFWTGSQTHVVRGEQSAVKALASINLASSLGTLAGPLIAGVLGSSSLQTALVVAAVVALLALVAAALLDRLPVFERPESPPSGRLWRRPGVNAGCWAGVSAGAWRSLVSSYVPVVLAQAGQTAAAIGSLVAIANFAQVFGQGIVRWLRGAGLSRAFAAGVLLAGGGLALVGLLADHVVGSAILLAVSGLGSGMLQTLGPAVASDAVDPKERGQAIAAAGTFRAAALFAVPLGASALVLVLPVAGALAIGGVAMTWPVVYTRRLSTYLRS